MNTSSESIWEIPLVKHMSVILLVKVFVLTLLWWLFFSASDDKVTQSIKTQNHISGSASANPAPEKYLNKVSM